MQTLDQYSTPVLRLGLAFVFAWFGLHQLLDPGSWTAFVPTFTSNPWISPETIILLNGWLEVSGAVLFLIGFLTRPAALILGLHMLFITIEMGGAIGVRDFGLTIACLSLALASVDRWSLDARLQ